MGRKEQEEQVWIRRDMFGEDFDCDRAAEAGVAGFVHLAHAPSPEGGDDRIGPRRVPGVRAKLAWIIRPARFQHLVARRTLLAR